MYLPRLVQGPRRQLWRRQSQFIFVLFCFVCRVCLFVVLETDLGASFPFPALLYLKSKLCSFLVRAPIIYLFICGSVFILVFTVIECTCMNIVSAISEFKSTALWPDSVHSAWENQAISHAGVWSYSRINMTARSVYHTLENIQTLQESHTIYQTQYKI